MKKVIGFSLGLLVLPVIALAQDLDNVETLVGSIGDIVNLLIPLAFAAALLFFFWGVASYIMAAGDEEKRKSGRSIMIWGVVALAVMASVFGLVKFLQDAFDIDSRATVDVPTVDIRN